MSERQKPSSKEPTPTVQKKNEVKTAKITSLPNGSTYGTTGRRIENTPPIDQMVQTPRIPSTTL